ncbi:MAG: DUF3788 family protein [Spirochaetales bacterium]|nr:DUF3788 family protein [Spirochaetales bacterium]
MDEILLNDMNRYPDDACLASCLGKAKAVWDEFLARAAGVSGLAFVGWRYYRDGKAWLSRLAFKKKTVCWISIGEGCFKTSFYFTAKNGGGIRALGVDDKLKAEYFARESGGKLKPFVVRVKAMKTLDDVFRLIDYKISCK